MNISIATIDDINDIQSFINNEWKENHILARDEFFFKDEYLYNNQVNFLIAKLDDKIQGLLGFIPSKIYKKNKQNYIEEASDYCATLWKVRKNNIYPSTGLQLLQSLRDLNGMGVLFCVGINEKTFGIYKYLDIHVGTMNHFVMINYNIKNFRIAKVSKLKTSQINYQKDEKISIKIVKDEIELLKFKFDNHKEFIPSKNKRYFIKRYFEHPIHRYNIFGSYFLDDLVALFVTRIQYHNEAKALRIIDFYGDQKYIKPFAGFLSDLIVKEKYEYAEFYCLGLDNFIMESSGFKLINQYSDDLIIPNYFNPFLHKNIPINFFLDSKDINRLRIFKGDGDQDRPS